MKNRFVPIMAPTYLFPSLPKHWIVWKHLLWLIASHTPSRTKQSVLSFASFQLPFYYDLLWLLHQVSLVITSLMKVLTDRMISQTKHWSPTFLPSNHHLFCHFPISKHTQENIWRISEKRSQIVCCRFFDFVNLSLGPRTRFCNAFSGSLP